MIEQMAIQLIMALKSSGLDKDAALWRFANLWDQVEVEVTIPEKEKH